jgi:UDP-N-acetylglucosamine--N-acetylmuramyl-(pentapeptide) pyrophosphoryl-undecaprenol N-acetylglucosamine transferase
LALIKIPLSMIDSMRILRQVRPDIAIGVGGYSSGPVILSAKLMGIPAMIHEQNTLPGLTNRILSRFVDAVAVTYQESMNYFPREKAYLTGNPVREEILQGDRERGYERFSLEKDRFTIFVFGGSRGATRINQAVVEALDFLQEFKGHVQFLHQTGERDLMQVKEAYRLKGFKGTVIPFAHNMADAYAVADLVISRAGATTLAEITTCGKAAILVPYPYAAGDHQEINARKLVDIGAARIIRDSELTGKVLSEMIIHVINNPDELRKMERLSASLGNPHATVRILEIIEGLLKKKTGYDNASIRDSILRY